MNENPCPLWVRAITQLGLPGSKGRLVRFPTAPGDRAVHRLHSQPNARIYPPAAPGGGGLGGIAELQAVAVNDQGQVLQPVVTAHMAASQLLPSCSSPSPVITYTRQGALDLARQGCPHRHWKPCPRAGVGLDPGHFVPVGVAFNLESGWANVSSSATGKKPRRASAVYNAPQECPLLKISRSRRPIGCWGSMRKTPNTALPGCRSRRDRRRMPQVGAGEHAQVGRRMALACAAMKSNGYNRWWIIQHCCRASITARSRRISLGSWHRGLHACLSGQKVDTGIGAPTIRQAFIPASEMAGTYRPGSLSGRRLTHARFQGIHTYYGLSHILFDVSLKVDKGRWSELSAATARAKPHPQEHHGCHAASATASFRRRRLRGAAPYQLARKGMGWVSRRPPASLPIYRRGEPGDRGAQGRGTEKWTSTGSTNFSGLKDDGPAQRGLLSGGEQKDAGHRRALMTNPSPAAGRTHEGLAPLLVKSLGSAFTSSRNSIDRPARRAELKFTLGLERLRLHHRQRADLPPRDVTELIHNRLEDLRLLRPL